MEQNALPVGFGMALAMNPAAMERFAAMSETEKQKLLERSGKVRSKQEMQQLVASLEDGAGQTAD